MIIPRLVGDFINNSKSETIRQMWTDIPEEIANLKAVYLALGKSELWSVYAGLVSIFLPVFCNEADAEGKLTEVVN